MTFIYNFLRKVWLYELKPKGECFKKFEEFKVFIEIQSEHKIKSFWLEDGMQFISRAFERFLKDHDIENQTSTLYRPQEYRVPTGYQNIVILQILQFEIQSLNTIVEIVRGIFNARNLHKSFWVQAVEDVVYT